MIRILAGVKQIAIVTAGLLVLGPLMPSAVLACEGVDTELELEEKGGVTDITFAGPVNQVLSPSIRNTNPFAEEVKIGTLEIRGRNPAAFRLEEQRNCEGQTLRRRGERGDSCTFRIRLEEEARPKEAELIWSDESLGVNRIRQTKRVLLLH